MTVRETCLIEVKNESQIYRGELHDVEDFAFSVLITLQLSAKHFSTLPLYFMKREDNVEKRWILKLILNFGGGPSETSKLSFLKLSLSLSLKSHFPQNGKHRWIFSLWRWFWCSHNYNWLLDKMDKECKRVLTLRFENIRNKDKKDYRKRVSCVIARTLMSLVIVYRAATYQ